MPPTLLTLDAAKLTMVELRLKSAAVAAAAGATQDNVLERAEQVLAWALKPLG